MFRSIAVPLDGSPAAEGALAYALSLAKPTGARLELVHVHHAYRPGEALEALPIYGWQGIVGYDNQADDRAFGHEWEELHALAGRVANESGLPAEVRVLRGKVAEEITTWAHAAGVDLIVLSRHGRGGVRRSWLGGVAEAVVRHSATPVLLVHSEGDAAPAEPAIRRILVPLDGSPFSEAVIRPAMKIALSTGARVTLLRVVKPGYVPSFLHAQPPAGPEAYLELLREALPTELGAIETRVLTDPEPALAIVEEAEENGYDLVAMATHGQGGPRSMLLGSTADRVLHGTRSPLLLFRPPHAEVAPRQPKRERALAPA
ncbi:MAG TPA: universal stress protein [Longimicrobiaceae bacterium]